MAHASDAPSSLPADFKPEPLRGKPGFFRVGQTRRGQWWLVDAHNRQFFSKGVTGVNRAGRADGRSTQPGPYTAAVDKIYGLDDPQAFVRAALARLEKWHLNTLGAWTGTEFFEQGFADTEILEFRRSGAEINAFGVKLPDVFD